MMPTLHFEDRTLALLDILIRRTGKTRKEIVQEAVETQWAKAQHIEPAERRPRK